MVASAESSVIAEQLTLAQAHSRTSRDAGRSIVGDRARLQTVVYLAIKGAGHPYVPEWAVYNEPMRAVAAGGLTDEEGMAVTKLPANTYRPRRVELVRQGRVRDSGVTRPTKSGRAAIIWEAME